MRSLRRIGEADADAAIFIRGQGALLVNTGPCIYVVDTEVHIEGLLEGQSICYIGS